jgi:cyclophilin family peptidyl-prolyl cis-trans isomerase
MSERDRNQRLRPTRPAPDVMEDRRLLSASLAPISNLLVPRQQGYALPLDGSGTADAQTFTITRTSGSPDIGASIVSGPFWTVNVQYTDPTNSANDFSGPLAFQLFNSAGSTTLTPNTVSHIEQFTNDGYYTSTGKSITRIATGFPSATDYVVQAGGPNGNILGSSGQPNTPFANEDVQQLAFTGTDQLGMANAGRTDSNDTQFFITTGSPNSELGYNYTIFGQLVSGQAILAMLTRIPVTINPDLGAENSLPVHEPVFSSVTLSNVNPNGVALIDTTQARPGDAATFQVTATDPTDGTSVSRTFTVTAGSYAGPSDPSINFRPLADSVAATATAGGTTTVAMQGRDGYPDPNRPGTLTYSLVTQPSHGTISDFNGASGTFVYTPQPGFAGTDAFQYRVHETGPLSTPASTTSDPAAVSVTVTPTPLVSLTGATDVVRRHRVTEIDLTFSGALDPTGASDTATYELIRQGPHGSSSAARAMTIRIKSASYDAATATVRLVPRKPFALGKGVEVVVLGEPPSGLHDSLGRLIDGNGDGQPGGNATAILARTGATLAVGSPAAATATADAVDALLAQSDAEALARTRAAAWLGGGSKKAIGRG